MLRNDSYLLKKIEDRFFLLPTGQDIVSGKKACEINEIGLMIWDELKEDLSKEEVAERVWQRICAEATEDVPAKGEINADICSFIDLLLGKGIVRYTNRFISCVKSTKYCIAGIGVRIFDEKNVLGEDLKDFLSASGDEDIKVYIDENRSPIGYYGAYPFLESEDVKIFTTEDVFFIDMKRCDDINEVVVFKNTKSIYINVKAYGKEVGISAINAIKLGFLYYSLLAAKIMLHSASVLYRDKLWLFSAASGIGKSTHAKLWDENGAGKIINGDANLISAVDGKVIVEGTPWCGTSGIYDNKSYELGGIIILERSDKPKVTRLVGSDAVLAVCRRALSPTWTKELMDLVISNVMLICEKASVVKLSCNMQNESYEVIREYLDTLV